MRSRAVEGTVFEREGLLIPEQSHESTGSHKDLRCAVDRVGERQRPREGAHSGLGVATEIETKFVPASKIPGCALTERGTV